MIPTSPDRFTAAWLEEKLSAPSGALRDFAYKPLGTGQMCDSFRLKLDWNGHEGPATIIAKCPSHDEKSRNIAQLISNYLREVNWYRELASQSKTACPRCYHAEIADNRVDFALLLGDCAPSAQGDQLAGANAASLRPAIDQLAALHAPFWNGDTAERHPWVAQDSSELVKATLPALATGFAERYATRLAPDTLDLCRTFADRIGFYLERIPSARSITHADYRIDNLLFAPDGGVTVVDFQTIGEGAPFADLAYCIGTSFADPAERRAEEEGLFAYYCDRLADHGVIADREGGWTDYRAYALSGVLMAIFASMNVERTERGDEMFAVMAERPARQAIELGSLDLL